MWRNALTEPPKKKGKYLGLTIQKTINYEGVVEYTTYRNTYYFDPEYCACGDPHPAWYISDWEHGDYETNNVRMWHEIPMEPDADTIRRLYEEITNC